MSYQGLETSRTQRTLSGTARLLLDLHIDGPLFIGLCLIGAVGSLIVFSASGRSLPFMEATLFRFGLGLVAMTLLAQVPPRLIRTVTPWVYLLGLLLLLIVMFTGHIAMGAQRWLDLGFVRFQPSELMKLAVPLACAWYLHERPLPPSPLSLLVLALAIGVPTLLIAEQPDLGTSLLVASSGVMVLLLAGLQLRYILSLIALFVPTAIIAWQFFLHDYQKQRVLTFLDPQRKAIRSVRAITSSNLRSRSAQAVCSARGI
jgi:rod shape determining protein RodA